MTALVPLHLGCDRLPAGPEPSFNKLTWTDCHLMIGLCQFKGQAGLHRLTVYSICSSNPEPVGQSFCLSLARDAIEGTRMNCPQAIGLGQ